MKPESRVKDLPANIITRIPYILKNVQSIDLKGIFLALLGFLALFIIGFLLQKQRRRREVPPANPRDKKNAKKIIYILRLAGFALLSLCVVILSIMVFIAYRSVLEYMRPTPSLVAVPPELPLAVEEVTFAGGEGLEMAGWYIPPQNGATIILLHGYYGNRTQMTWHAGVLAEGGYGVLMYDERASGESEGDHRSFGWEDPADVGGALGYLNGRLETDPTRIGIAGCSIGGQIALQSMAMYPQLGAVWADGSAVVNTGDTPWGFSLNSILAMPTNYFMDWIMAAKLGRSVPTGITKIIGAIEPRPILLVAAGPEATSIEYLASFAGPSTQVWIIPEAHHCGGLASRPEEYSARMLAFFDKALQNSP